MDLKLRDKVGIVTGASRGIGAGIARLLGAEGCKLMLAARSTIDLDEVTAGICQAGGQATARPADLIAPAAARELVDATVQQYGKLDFVIAAAGSGKTGNFLSVSDDDWAEGFGLKFFGHMRLIRAAWPHLKASHGSVITLAGGRGRTPTANGVITGAVNSAVMNLTKSLADMGVADGVQVNGVLPGSVRSARWLGRRDKFMQKHGVSAEEAETRMVAEGRQVRMGEPQDIAAMVAFILSPNGSYLHGALIDVDGGRNKGL